MKFLFTLITISLFFLFPQTESKTISDLEFLSRFDRRSWSYLTKFAMGPGKGTLEARVQFYKVVHSTKPLVNVTLLVYSYEGFQLAQSKSNCKDKSALANMKIPLELPTNADWGPYIHQKLEQRETQVWFFALADCEKSLSPFSVGNRIRWEVQLWNSDGSHFSEDENSMLRTLVLVLFFIGGFLVLNSMKFIKFYKKEEEMDYPTLITSIALFIEFLSIFCEILHLWIYSYDGKGSAFFNFSNQILSITSQFIITCLLLLIAYGWSIRFLDFEEMDVFIPLGILLGIMHIVIIGIGKIMDNEHYKFHDYENWAGVVVVILRILLYVFWVFLFVQTYESAKHKERSFYQKFGVFSSIYFLAFPVLVIIATFFVTPHAKHKVVSLGTLILQTGTLLILSLIFTTKSTQYYQVSLKGKILLPSNKME